MSRLYRVAVFVPAILAIMNVVLAVVASAGPCLPGDAGC